VSVELKEVELRIERLVGCTQTEREKVSMDQVSEEALKKTERKTYASRA
jgi:hypothetical protein